MTSQDILPVIQRKNPEREFEILKQIGSGTYGEVFKARVVKTQELVALKIIKIEPGEDFNIIQQEIHILSDCKHPNIVGYYGSYLRRDKLWIAMEFCGGGSLQDIYHITNQGLNELQIAFVCRETLKGLQYLHERNKMHRDIKGANILLTDNGDVKLADFGIAAQLTQTLLMKRKSFIGTPYWMAPEVAAVERKGGYNHQCDIWAVGITAVELAETQPPMFDLHPMRALYLMTKRNFKSPGLTHKNKWSENFHDFLRCALQKDPKRRPTAAELLKHEYVARPELCSQLMLSLIKVLEAPPPKPKHQASEDDEKDPDEEVRSSNQKKFRRVSSVKNKGLINRQQSDAQMQQISLPVRDEAPSNSELLLPAWLQSAAVDQNYRPRIEKLAATEQMREESEYVDPDRSPTTPPPSSGPPLPPKHGGAPRQQTKSPANEPGNGQQGSYGGPSQPPLPPRASQRSSQQTPVNSGPPLPPRKQNGPRRPERRSGEGNRKAYFSKIFNGCPLHLNCASSWTHPISKMQYVLFGAEEGLFSLLVTNNPDPVMEQVSSRPCHWIRVVENALIWLSGRNNRIVSMTNLILLFQSESARASLQHRSRQHTTKITDSRGCTKCCIARNPFSDQRYLIAAVPRGILLLQWFQPRHTFMHVMLFECQIPQPLNLLEAYVVENEEYPIVVLGVKESSDGTVLFETLNLNSQASWYSDQPEGRPLHVLCLQQLEKDTIFIGMERAAKFVGRDGQLKPSTIQASHITFDKTSEHMVFLSNCVLSFHRHGMQGKSLATQQVTAEVADGSKVFHLLGSHGTIVIETRPADEPTSPSNIYILVSEDTPHQTQ